MINELKAMAIFAEVVNKGSFREASKSLALSPSVVSYHISQLEEKLGAALIYRSTRKLTLSHDGEVFYQHVLQMLSAANQGLSLLSNQSMTMQGKVKLSLPTGLSRSYLNERIAKFATSYPNVTMEIEYSDTRNNIIEQGVDLTLRAGELEDSDFIAKKIGTIERVLVCTPRFYQKQITPKQPSDLANWQWLKLSQLSNERTFIKAGEQQNVRFSSQISVNSVEAIYQYCLNDVGLAVLTQSQVEADLAQGKLVHVLPNWQVTSLPLYAMWPKNTPPKSLVKVLLNALMADDISG